MTLKDRPILFSGPMVRAILDGRKTQTRRVVKGVGNDNCIDYRVFIEKYGKKIKCRTHVLDAPKRGLCPYGHPSGVECIEIARHMNFNLGNAMKYLWRAGQKNDAVEDLQKAAWYIADEIKRLQHLRHVEKMESAK